MSLDRVSFDGIAERLGLDEFERIAICDLLEEIEVTTDLAKRDRLTIGIGVLVEHHIDRWLTEGGR